MKSIARTAIILGLVATTQVAATSQKLRGRNLEGECEGVENGAWVPSPGCRGAAWCFGGGPYFLYPCSEDKRYDEKSGGCLPANEVECVTWASLNAAVSDAVSDALDTIQPDNIRKCNTDEEKAAYKACKKANCLQGDEDCKAECRNDHCEW
mmetsp:Transcript_2831/g.6554  ORF Transcript_2831/g.6554 Transcript_2831/m.6554 type:complete len:152 (-) Transcript_2831:259-714(-)